MFNYLINKHREKLINILNDENENKHFSLQLTFVDIFDVDQSLGNAILKTPEEGLASCDQVIVKAQEDLIEQFDSKTCTLKHNVHARIFGLPTCPELHRTVLPKPNDLGTFLQLSGLIVKASSVKMLEYRRDYVCNKCKYKETVFADHDKKYSIDPPNSCKNPESCKGVKFKVASSLDANHCKDYQEIKMQEQGKAVSNAMWLILEDDLVDICKPGDSITVCGIVKHRVKKTAVVGAINYIEMTLLVNHLQVNNDVAPMTSFTADIKQQFDIFWYKYQAYPLYGRDLILRSFCPQIYGMYMAKLAVVVVLAGGSTFNVQGETNVRTRTEPHLLLVGDPGTGKSELLRFAAKVIPRSVRATGITSTSAGLTAAAVHEDGQWHLEAGALVQADGGICCIDEFNTMKVQERNSILEAMEQQTVSVAKASIVTKLQTRCSILAAMNFKKSSDSLTKSLGLASPLLSRFDLILTVTDNHDANWDEHVADYILNGCKYRSKFFDEQNNKWTLEMLQAYFALIKNINPKPTEAANKIIAAYYQLQRGNSMRTKARTTIRLLDSLVRLSQAHARLMHHENVLVMDTVIAISLIEYSISEEGNTLSLDSELFKDYPVDPTEAYDNVSRTILAKLNLLGIKDDEKEYPENAKEIVVNSKRKSGVHFERSGSFENVLDEDSRCNPEKPRHGLTSKKPADLVATKLHLKNILQNSKFQVKSTSTKLNSFASGSSFSSESVFDTETDNVDLDL